MSLEEHTAQGIAIVGGIANIAALIGKYFTFNDLAQLLTMFGHLTSEGKNYKEPQDLVTKASKGYRAVGDSRTAGNIDTYFVNNGVDTTLL
jgi:hypothetical protein